jgi:SAM-dependent methyltransferase
MSKAVYFDKYDAQGAYHWAECDRRLANWKRYNPALDARYELTVRALGGLGALDNLLDVGCGDGFLMARAAKHLTRLVGVDSEAGAIHWAREKLRAFPNCTVMHTTCYELPFPPRSFAAVTSADVIEHLKDPGHHLQEIARVLKESGALVLTTPQWRPDRKWDVRHEKEYRPGELRSLLETRFGSVQLDFFWPMAWSNFYSTRVGWRLLKLVAIAGWNPFLRQASQPEKFCQILAVCRNPKP